jgi:hypothetical protein
VRQRERGRRSARRWISQGWLEERREEAASSGGRGVAGPRPCLAVELQLAASRRPCLHTYHCRTEREALSLSVAKALDPGGAPGSTCLGAWPPIENRRTGDQVAQSPPPPPMSLHRPLLMRPRSGTLALLEGGRPPISWGSPVVVGREKDRGGRQVPVKAGEAEEHRQLGGPVWEREGGRG